MFWKAFINSFPLLFMVLIMTACQSPFSPTVKREGVLVRVYDQYLTYADIKDLVPPNMHAQDSINIINAYISNWVQQKVLIHKANQNLAENEKSFDKKIEEYKNSLLIFTYQNKVSEKLLDTQVDPSQILAYYNENQEQFELKSSIVKPQFIKLNKANKNIQKIKYIFLEPNLEESDYNTLEDLCSKNADNYFFDTQDWVYFSDLLKEIPIVTYNQDEFLKNNKHFEVLSGDYLYLVRIVDFKVKNMTSPLEFETEKIKAIIINHRKQQLIEQMQAQLIAAANKDGQIEYYAK